MMLTAVGAAIGFLCIVVTWIASAPRPIYPLQHSDVLDPGDPDRGKIVFLTADCASCHASPGQGDRRKLGGGMALSAPFGTFYVPNISPDPENGIGQWTTADLANALLAGVSPDGQHYYPVFPYTSFTHMRTEDIRDLMAYLRTLPRVKGRAPDHELPFLFVRRSIGLWKLVFFERSPITENSIHDASWNRGHYLVEATAHCAECHSTRNVFGAIEPKTRFAGGPDPSSVGYVPNITPGAIGSWTKRQISQALEAGITPNLRGLGSSMADVVFNLSQLPQSDRDAIADYLTTLPKRPTPNPAASQ
jgi:mono/diheme cytochrome c family protein